MHFESRPAWRYQWSAVVVIASMLAMLFVAELYGPIYLGLRGTHTLQAAAFALAVYSVLLIAYRHLAWRYLVDEHNIESYHGVLARRVQSIRIADLRNVNIRQSVMQRLLDVGDVEFSSAGGDDVEVIFFGVAEPMRVKELVRHLQDGPIEK
jgi:uncharacterized membrane protein YdbT with pleckstrin-like domain